jgi:hypothetical protein
MGERIIILFNRHRRFAFPEGSTPSTPREEGRKEREIYIIIYSNPK